MVNAIWTGLTVMALGGMFVACVLLVVVGVRGLESWLAKRGRKPSA